MRGWQRLREMHAVDDGERSISSSIVDDGDLYHICCVKPNLAIYIANEHSNEDSSLETPSIR